MVGFATREKARGKRWTSMRYAANLMRETKPDCVVEEGIHTAAQKGSQSAIDCSVKQGFEDFPSR